VKAKKHAEITRTREMRCTGKDLADAVAKVELSVENARDWHHELEVTRKTLQVPTGKK
jgi:hypothetical protein